MVSWLLAGSHADCLCCIDLQVLQCATQRQLHSIPTVDVHKKKACDNCVRHLRNHYQPNKYAKMSGATMVASLSMMYLGVWMSSLPQVIFSLGTAPL